MSKLHATNQAITKKLPHRRWPGNVPAADGAPLKPATASENGGEIRLLPDAVSNEDRVIRFPLAILSAHRREQSAILSEVALKASLEGTVGAEWAKVGLFLARQFLRQKKAADTSVAE